MRLILLLSCSSYRVVITVTCAAPSKPVLTLSVFTRAATLLMETLKVGCSPEWLLMGTLKEWHQEISRDLRDLVVGRLAKGILSSLDPIVTDDQRIHDAINIAQKVETATFELANNQEEYYHLLTQEICEFQRGRQDWKNSGVRADGGTGVTAGVAAGGCGAGKPHLQRNRNSGCSEFERGVCERNGSSDATLGLLLFTEVIVYLTAVVLWELM